MQKEINREEFNPYSPIIDTHQLFLNLFSLIKIFEKLWLSLSFIFFIFWKTYHFDKNIYETSHQGLSLVEYLILD